MTNTTDRLLEDGAIRALSARQAEPDWLIARRQEAWRIFQAMELPTGFEEEWRRTDISGLDLPGALARLENSRGLVVLPAEFTDTSGLDGLVLQQEGEITKRTRSPRSPEAVFMDLAAAARDHPETVRRNLGALVLPSEWKLQALAAAMWSGGAFVHVPPSR